METPSGDDEEEVGGGASGYIGEFSSEYVNAEIFKLFDTDGSGKLTRADLHDCAKAMGWNE
jgi:Ca2+-binding EF-hand superfamily protein